MSLLLLFKKSGVVITGTASFTEDAGSFVAQGIGDQSQKHRRRGYSQVLGKATFQESAGSFVVRGLVVLPEIKAVARFTEDAGRFSARCLTFIPEVKGTATLEEFAGKISAKGFVTEGDEEIVSIIQILAEMV